MEFPNATPHSLNCLFNIVPLSAKGGLLEKNLRRYSRCVVRLLLLFNSTIAISNCQEILPQKSIGIYTYF